MTYAIRHYYWIIHQYDWISVTRLWHGENTVITITNWMHLFLIIPNAIIVKQRPPRSSPTLTTLPVNTWRWTNGGLILGHRLRRWPSIKPPLIQRHVFTRNDYRFCLAQSLLSRTSWELICLCNSGPQSAPHWMKSFSLAFSHLDVLRVFTSGSIRH